VRIPVASAILAMRFPEEYAIIDKNVIKALDNIEALKWLKNDEYVKNPDIYCKYLKSVRESAEKKGCTLRECELELFEKGKGKE